MYTEGEFLTPSCEITSTVTEYTLIGTCMRPPAASSTQRLYISLNILQCIRFNVSQSSVDIKSFFLNNNNNNNNKNKITKKFFVRQAKNSIKFFFLIILIKKMIFFCIYSIQPGYNSAINATGNCLKALELLN